MGIAPHNTFTFDGVSSSTYGVYLTGEGVFNAPERAVEMLSIPGRNGNYALDLGRFENISVTYKVGMFDVDESNFATKVSNFRNWLCSKVGYVRLTDTYNTGEYRMAVYKSGLELDHKLLIAGEAEITFECKPQRFLTSGETAVAVVSGGKVTNPTLFDARPQLQVYGGGTINIGTQTIKIITSYIGNIIVLDRKEFDYDDLYFDTVHTYFSDQYANLGDSFVVQDSDYFCEFVGGIKTINNVEIVSVSGTGTSTVVMQGNRPLITLHSGECPFVYGTAATQTTTGTYNATMSDSSIETITIGLEVAYDGADKITLNVTRSHSQYILLGRDEGAEINTIILNSTKSALGNPMYIDLDIGEAYKIENNTAISVNNAVLLPAELPTLPPGDTTITYDNTITQFKVLPRWWRV